MASTHSSTRKSPVTPARVPFSTWIGDLAKPIPGTRFCPLPAIGDLYRKPEDVPVSLRHTLRYAHDSGLTVQSLADIYGLPAEWVAQFVSNLGDLDVITVRGAA